MACDVTGKLWAIKPTTVEPFIESPIPISDAWCSNIPVLHQIMNGSRSHSDFPSPISGVELQDACAIWEPLHYLLKSLLGWQNRGKGLTWWYQAGKPVSESPLLQLAAQLWD